MSTRVEVLHIPIGDDVAEIRSQPVAQEESRELAAFDSFKAQQLRALVHQVFFPSLAKSRRQIVFSSVDENVDVGGICTMVAESLALHVSETVGIVDAHACSRDRGVRPEEGRGPARVGIRGSSNSLPGNLWSIPGPAFWGNDERAGSPSWVRGRLRELRTEFDYTVIHAPAAGIYSGTSLLGQSSDGLVLVIEANYTRRSTAQRAKESLLAANVRILGTILSGREFPIPERIYQRL
jgi:hypothetical protein